MCHTHSIPEMRTQRGSTCEFLLHQLYFYVTPLSVTYNDMMCTLYKQFLKSEMVDLGMCDVQIGELEQEMAAKFVDFERKTEDMPKDIFVNGCFITSHFCSLTDLTHSLIYSLTLTHTFTFSH